MITAVDTNVLLDLLLPDKEFVDRSTSALEEAEAAGSLTICDIVYAELCVHFPKQRLCDGFLEETGIRVEALNRSAGFLASRAWRAYRSRGGTRKRILTDFLIGAHAQTIGVSLLARDAGYYRDYFRNLTVIAP